MSLSERPQPHVDDDPVRGPGGADADVSESDVGAASQGAPVTPDPPLSAQQEDAPVLDELSEPETSDTGSENAETEEAAKGSEPTG